MTIDPKEVIMVEFADRTVGNRKPYSMHVDLWAPIPVGISFETAVKILDVRTRRLAGIGPDKKEAGDE